MKILYIVVLRRKGNWKLFVKLANFQQHSTKTLRKYRMLYNFTYHLTALLSVSVFIFFKVDFKNNSNTVRDNKWRDKMHH
jgi:hypothetical protein